MDFSHALSFSPQTFSFNNTVEIYHSKKKENAATQYFAFLDENLYNYEYSDKKWNENLLLNDTFKKNVLYFPKILDDDLMLIKTIEGIDFYAYQNDKFELVSQSSNYDENIFDDFYERNDLICGHIFNKDSTEISPNSIGILAKHVSGTISVFIVLEGEINDNKYPIWDVTTPENIFGNDPKAKFFLADLKRKGQENIVLLNTSRLNVFEFDKNDDLHRIYEIAESRKDSDTYAKIFFPDLTGQKQKDIVLFNSRGLFLYQYRSKKDNYRLIHYNPLFSEENGWNEQYIDTIRFKDINFDGKQEMIFTGPGGIDILSFDNYRLRWNSVLDVSKINIPNRHNYIVDVVSITSKNQIIFTRGQKKLQWANIENGVKLIDDSTEDSEEIVLSQQDRILSGVPEVIIPKSKDEEKLHILLRDQLDWSSIIGAADKDTGKARFKLPLISLPNIPKEEKISFYYNGNKQDSSILGVGWTFPLGFIIMDHQKSIFPENEKYFLLLDNFPQPLIKDSENSTDTDHIFKLSNEESMTEIHYFKNEERWEVEYKGVKQIYGRRKGTHENAINWDLSWKNWRGVGSSSSGQIELPTAWFLTEIRSEPSSAIYYTYDINNVRVPNSNKKFTREVYLKSISDNEGNKVTFKYSIKNWDEYILSPLLENGNYKLSKVQTRYLSSYSVHTDSYQQNVNFIYNVENGKRLLTEIKQDNDPINTPVLQFYYQKIANSHQLEKAILPTGTSVKFTYEAIVGKSFNPDRINLISEVSNNYKIDYGPDFVLITYVNNSNRVVLKMYDRSLNEMYSSLSRIESTRFPFLGRSVHYYETKIFDNSLVFIFHHGDDKSPHEKDVCIINKEKNKLSLEPICYEYDRYTMTQIGNDFIVVVNTEQFLIEIIFWDSKLKDWTKRIILNKEIFNSTDLLLRTSGNIFLIYNDNVLTIGYRNKKNEWQTKDHNLPGVISGITRSLKKFNLHKDVYTFILSILKNNAFQVNNNFILFNKWNIEDNKISSDTTLLTFNSSYDVDSVKNHKFTPDSELVTDVSKKIEAEDGKKRTSFFTLGYEEDGENYKIIITNIEGAIIDDINKDCGNKVKCQRESLNQIKEKAMEAKKFDKIFLVDFQKYLTFLMPTQVICGKEKLAFDGNEWKLQKRTEEESILSNWSIPIADKFIIAQESSQSTIKLYKLDSHTNSKGSLLFDLPVKHITQLLNKYPSYLVYQRESGQLNILFYDYLNYDTVQKTFSFPRGETMSVMSDYYTLVTHSSTGDNTTILLNLRQFVDIRTALPNPVIKSVTIDFDDGYKRVTGYDYDKLSAKVVGDILYYEKTYTIPNNERGSSGYIEETNKLTENLSVSRIYDAKANLVKTIQQDDTYQRGKNKTNTNETENLKSLILDVTGSLAIADFFPYQMEDDEAAYYGFEDYEINKIGAQSDTNKNRWQFNEADVAKKMFSLTGENYLSLSNSRLLGIFSPNNQNQNYVASCWVRSHGHNLQVGAIAPYLKAVVYTEDNREINGYLSEVNFKYDDWYYLEVVVDLFYSRDLLTDLAANHAKNLKPLKIIIIAAPDKNNIIDVDHIRFSPLDSNFYATTYNFKTKDIKEVINANGLIERYLYNNYNDQIIKINEDGNIGNLATYTKSSSIASIVNLKSEVKVQPIEGFLEDFNPHAFLTRWKIDNEKNWKISRGELHHLSEQLDYLKLNDIPNGDSYGIRLYFSLQSRKSLLNFNDVLQLRRNDNKAVIIYSSEERPIPFSGEILLIAEQNRLMVWIDGGLYIDDGTLNQSLFDLNMVGNVNIRDVLLFTEPSVQITYSNALGEKVQDISLESANSVIVIELLYDEYGRQSITTKSTRLQRSDKQNLVAYYKNFVTNKNPSSENSVWKINRIQGEFEELKPHDFYRMTYKDNPLNEKSAVGLPGEEFSVTGSLAMRYASSTRNAFIKRHYPQGQNYRYEVEYKLDGIEDIKVINTNNNNTVAWLIDVQKRGSLLATYEYNDDGKLIKVLSPLYHANANTLLTLSPDIQFYMKENNEQLRSLRLENSYNENENLVERTAPDAGKVENIYDEFGLLKFKIFHSNLNSSTVENAIYFKYDYLGRLTNTGRVISPPKKEELLKLPLTKYNTEEYQMFYQSDSEREPAFRGKLKRSITHNDGIPFIEEYWLGNTQNILSKRIIVLNEKSEEPLTISVNKVYKGGKLKEIEYPVNVQGEPFKVSYSYDRLGQIKEIGIPGKDKLFAEFTYNSVGQIATEHHLPNHINFNFTRKYNYNSASYLTKLEDKFLTENVHYIDGSYSGRQYGDSSITRTEFVAKWHELYADSDQLSLNEFSFVGENMTPEESQLCFTELKNAGYINERNRQAKVYYPSLELEFPTVCTTGSNRRRIQHILGAQGFPSKYGHMYDYGPYQELVKAKYFVGDELPEELHPNSFDKKIAQANNETSYDIWEILNSNHFITAKKEGSSNIISNELRKDLRDLDSSQFYSPLEKILGHYFSQKLLTEKNSNLIQEKLAKLFLKWSPTKDAQEKAKLQQEANKIIKMLKDKKYLINPLNKNFSKLLKNYSHIFPDIVNVLLNHFGNQLTEAEFDVQAYHIDENGNHRLYYNGFERYELVYHKNSNKIDYLVLNSYSSFSNNNYLILHDSRGNIVQALHKGIKNITYHAVSNRTTSIEMVDGRKIIFYYDAKGERILKRVLDAAGQVKKEVHYVRDEFGRTLVERQMTWSSPKLPPSVLVTLFIYGPKGIIGFIRRDEYYSVITDHEGSTRLVVKDGEVVAAYDYLPYGGLMRQYGSNVDAHISYRYTGQEWDEETDLYNYHARFYDTHIGRFYQHDPKMQYFSPYKYAGNSPISMVDPDGEIAFLVFALILVFGIVGAYLGAVAYSGSWDPTDWNFKDPMLYVSLGFGFISGALMPVTFGQSVAALTALGVSYGWSVGITVLAGVVGMYVGMARAGNEWDPTKWDYSDPGLWNAAYVGFGAFAGIAGTVQGAVQFYTSLSTAFAKGLFVAASLGTSATYIALKLAGRDLDFSKPGVYADIFDGLVAGADLPMLLNGGYRYFKKNFGEALKKLNTKKIPLKIKRIATAGMAYSLKALTAIEGIEYLAGSGVVATVADALINSAVTNEGEIDLSTGSTYDSFLNGLVMSLNLTSSNQLLNIKKKYAQRITDIEESRAIANETTSVYRETIKHFEFPRDSFTDNVRDRLTLPNSVIAVANTKDGKAFVAFSGREGPGYLSCFRNERGGQIGYDPQNPTEIRKVAIDDNPEENSFLLNSIKQKVQLQIEENYKRFEGHKPKLELTLRKLLQIYLDGGEISRIMNVIQDEIKNKGYLTDQNTLTNIILIPIARKKDLFTKSYKNLSDEFKINRNTRSKLLQLEKDIVVFQEKVGLPKHEIKDDQSIKVKKREVAKQLKEIEKITDNVSYNYISVKRKLEEKVWNGKSHKSVISSLWEEDFKIYKGEFADWSPVNCAAPNGTSLVYKNHQIFPMHVGGKYTAEDIKYIPSYEVNHDAEVPLVDKERCFNCKISTQKLKKSLTDPQWEMIIKSERNAVLSKVQRLNFFMPYDDIYEQGTNETIIKNGGIPKREKSSRMISKKNINSDRSKRIAKRSVTVESDKPVNSVSENSRNKTSDFFGWLGTTVNKLFNKVLPAKASAPKLLEGVSHSNNNLAAVSAVVDVNGTILLLDALIRKVTGQKYARAENDYNSSLLDARAYSLDVGLAFERTLSRAASKSGISMHRFNMHYIDIQEKVIDKIMSGKLDEIAGILISHAEKACPQRERGCPGKLSSKKFKKFISEFSREINEQLDQIMQEHKGISGNED